MIQSLHIWMNYLFIQDKISLNFSLDLEAFDPYLKHDGDLKSIWIFPQDGHDGPRFPATCQTLTTSFKDNDIYYLITACNVAGLLTFHFIKQQITPSSKELSRIVLSHKSFGFHLDENEKTTDNVDELENCKSACELLSEILSEMTTNGYQVSAKWVDPSDESKAYHCFTDPNIGVDWMETHVFVSKYCLQIAKSND